MPVRGTTKPLEGHRAQMPQQGGSTGRPADRPENRTNVGGEAKPPMEFKLLLIVVESERVDPVLEAVLEAGASGATLLSNARGLGLSKRTTFLGLELFQRRAILLVLVDATRADHVLQVAETAGQLDETLGTGIALQLPVEKALGLTEHIKRLAQEHPE